MPRSHRVLVVTGMHRSGTSLLASLAAAAGVDMGTRLMPGSKGNPRGHFEDLDFVRFHEGCLDLRGCGALSPPADGVQRFDEEEARAAAALLARRAGKPAWGWKDPRTCLFLPAWDALLAEPLYLLVYRHPVEVALSLVRRGLDVDVQRDAWITMRAWTLYNRQLLAFRTARRDRCLLWSIAGAAGNLSAALAAAERRSGLPLAGRGFEAHLAPGELRSGLLAKDIAWSTLLPEAMDLFARLEAAADLPGGETGVYRDPDSLASARERELEEANERLLASALAASQGRSAVEPPARHRLDDAALEPRLAPRAERSDQLAKVARRLRTQLERRNEELARVEATRSWRLVHSYWRAARRWRGLQRQSAWRLARLAGALPRPRPAEIVIGCVAENDPRLLTQAYWLVRSLRWFGGSLAGARMLVCVVDGIPPASREALERAGAEVRIVERFDRRNPAANKLQFFSEALATGARWMLLLDCDMAFVADPLPQLASGALQAKIADVASVTHEAFARLFRHYGFSLPPQRYRTTLHREPTILYCNTAMVFLTRELARELVPVWRDWNARILDALHLLGPCAHHCHQASFSLAMSAHPVPFAEAPPALNYPLHIRLPVPPPAMLEADPVILHYHNQVDAVGCLLPCLYPRAQERIEALNRRLEAARDENGPLPW